MCGCRSTSIPIAFCDGRGACYKSLNDAHRRAVLIRTKSGERLPKLRRKHVRLIALLLVVGVVRPSSEVFAASSDGSLLAPSEVVLYVHTELPNTAFLDPLICALQRVLLAPVSTKKIDLKLGPELLASPTQFDVGKVANRFIQATAGDGESHTFKYLLMPSDLKATPYRCVRHKLWRRKYGLSCRHRVDCAAQRRS